MWLEPQPSVHLGEVSAYERFKMDCLYIYVAGTTTLLVSAL